MYNSSKDRFKDTYEKVIDSNGNVKPVGRSMCMMLISACEEYDNSKPYEYYGRHDVGIVNLTHVIELYKSL